MKNWIILTLACAKLFLTPLNGEQLALKCVDYNPYFQILGGLSFLNAKCGYGSKLEMQLGSLVSGSLGCSLPYKFRVEGEFAYRYNRANNIHFFGEKHGINLAYKTISLMTNLFYDIPLKTLKLDCRGFIPYVGLGVGYDNQQYKTDDFHGCVRAKNGIFPWQLMAGVRYIYSDMWNLSLGYNYHASGTKGIHYQAVTIGATCWLY